MLSSPDLSDDSTAMDSLPSVDYHSTSPQHFVYPCPRPDTPTPPRAMRPGPLSLTQEPTDPDGVPMSGSSRPKRGSPSTSPKPAAKKAPDKRSTAWLFTLFGERATSDYMAELYEKKGVVFLTGQLEKCPDTGKLHIQGYIIVQPRDSLIRVKALFLPDKPHLEMRKGDHASCMDYVSKEDTRVIEGGFSFSFGKESAGLGGRAVRNDLAEVAFHYCKSCHLPQLCDCANCHMADRALRLVKVSYKSPLSVYRALCIADEYHHLLTQTVFVLPSITE